MKLPEAIILAGGLGTRLKSEFPDLPKCMVPVAGKPFIDHLISTMMGQGITDFVFSLGYKSEIILEHLSDHWKNLQYSYVIENEPLGTGGAILFASSKIRGSDYFVFNGDTLFIIDPHELFATHTKKEGLITIALKPMKNFDRYGNVAIDANQKISAFKEKTFCADGLINGGIYLVNKKCFLLPDLPQKFSFEKDVIEVQVENNHIYGHIFDGYFIDIGIPDDYRKADMDLRIAD